MIMLRLLFALPFAVSIAAYLIYPAWMDWASFPAPSWVRWTGLAAGSIAIPAVYWVLKTLGPNVSETILTKDSHRFVTKGPYGWVRHPLYTTGLVLLAAVGLMATNWFILLLSGLCGTAIRYLVIPQEEDFLEARFGSEYRHYKKRTGMLFPLMLRQFRSHGRA